MSALRAKPPPHFMPPISKFNIQIMQPRQICRVYECSSFIMLNGLLRRRRSFDSPMNEPFVSQ